MPLDPKAEEMLATMTALGFVETSTLPVEEAREAALRRREVINSPLRAVSLVEDRIIPGSAGPIPIRIYNPDLRASAPVIVFFHGGGWVICNLDTHDALCRALASETGAVVVSVDYRLAPEHRFPAPLDDCFDATIWAARNAVQLGGDPQNIFVGGDSAGGNLAAVVALRIRDEGGPPLAGQLLVYPVTDYYNPGTVSYVEFADGYGLSRASMIWFWDHYLDSKSRATDPYASPLRATDLSGLPPTLVIIAEYDPLRDEGEEYARRLRQANVDTELVRFDGMLHGFFSAVGFYHQTDEAIAHTAKWLARVSRNQDRANEPADSLHNLV